MRALWIALLLPLSLSASGGMRDAHTYRNHSQLQWDWAMEALSHSPLKGDERILDVGSGDGKITAAIAEMVPSGYVLGIDISPTMVASASGTYFDIENLTFIETDASALPFHEEFDLVFSSNVLHWIPNQRAALEGIHAALKPGGRFLLVLSPRSNRNVVTVGESVVRSSKWASQFPDFINPRIYLSGDEAEALCEEVGLEAISIAITTAFTTYPNWEALVEWLRPMTEYTHHLSLPLQEAFLRDLADAVCAIDPPAADGTITIPRKRLEILARKTN